MEVMALIGPGCSSFTGLFMELGPCNVNRNGTGTTFNKYSWNQNANVIFLDQPVGTGFSYSNKTKISTSEQAAKDVYIFLRMFKSAFLKNSDLKFHIAGESYAGHYIPWIAKVIIQENKLVSPENKINLESVAIGNGFTDAVIQNQNYVPMLKDAKFGNVLPESVVKRMEQLSPVCDIAGKTCYKTKMPLFCAPSEAICAKIYLDPYSDAGLNFYDMRLKPNDPILDEYSDAVEKYINQDWILKELGVNFEHASCDDNVFKRFSLSGDEGMPTMLLVPELLLAGLRILIYAGDADYICNWMGNKAWILNMDWEGKEGINSALDIKITSPSTGKLAGEVRSHMNLSFLKVYDAGHYVPFDQPQHSQEMINSWLNNKSFV